MTMLTRIGNSQGVRIPKPIIKQANLENSEIEFEVTKDGLLLKPVKTSVRQNWKKNIQRKTKNIKDDGIIEDFLNEDIEKWEW